MTTLIDRPTEAHETLSDADFEHDLDALLRSAHRAQDTRDEIAAEGVRARRIQRRRLIRLLVVIALVLSAVTAAVIGMVRHAEAVQAREEMEARVAAYTAAVEAEQEWLDEQAALVEAERVEQVRAELAARWETATETLDALVADGEDVLDESKGKVDDNTSREDLSDALAALTAARDGDSLLDAEAAAETDLSDLIAAVSTAVQSREDRLAEQARIAAEREAARIAAQQAAQQSTSTDGSGSSTPAVEQVAAQYGYEVVYGLPAAAPGYANGIFNPATPGVIYIRPGFGHRADLARHEIGHGEVQAQCNTWNPPIANGRPEQVASAYAALYLGAGAVSGSHGYTNADADAARLIHGGTCS